MAGRIPQDFLDTLLGQTNLVDLVEEKVTLRQSGRDLIGLCPFHEERSPSFTVSPVKQFYHCFGCGAHGNAFQFVQTLYHLPFKEAVAFLAKRKGLKMPEVTGSDAVEERRRNRLLTWVEQADRWFRRQLRTHPSRAKAIHYLKGRGLEGRTAATFGLGFAPPGWTSLTRHLQAQGADLKDLVELGLTINQSCGSPLDRFRNRITFPIRDRLGRTRGFGARIIGEGRGAKYLNSHDSPVFHKGRLVYGLYEALKAVPRPQELIVVEGYLDAQALHQEGLQTAVALMGTAGTGEQLATLFQCCPRLVFALDGDSAGQAATGRLVERLLPLLDDGREVALLKLPIGEDPDEFIRMVGRASFQRQLQQAQPLSAFLIETLKAQVPDTTTPEGASRFMALASSLLERLPVHGTYRVLLRRCLSATVGLEDVGTVRQEAGTSRVYEQPLDQ